MPEIALAVKQEKGLVDMRKSIVIVLIMLFVTSLLGGCSGGRTAEKIITVSAAASMKDALGEIKQQFEKNNPGVKISFNFGSSGTLQQQIEQGAPVDVFISAGNKQVSVLKEKGLVDEPRIVAGNDLVVVVPDAAGSTITDLKDLTGGNLTTIAMGTPETVPAGKYAEEALKKSGIMEQVRLKLVPAKDVRQVLTYVETGEADVGLVYSTDARVSGKVDIAFEVPAKLHSPIVYPAVVVKSSGNPEQAGLFLGFLGSPSAKSILEKYGFALP